MMKRHLKKHTYDKKKGYCCWHIEDIVKQTPFPEGYGENMAIKYIPEYREFLVTECAPTRHVRADMQTGFHMSYCPFCSAKFPKSLRDIRKEILIKEYKINPLSLFDTDNKNIPPEFHTDEWWKQRNL